MFEGKIPFVPRWEATETESNLHPIQIITYVTGGLLFLFSLYLVSTNTGLSNILLFIFSLSFLIYVIGRIYGQVTLDQDFVEITKEHVSFRSTPPFGMGWLPRIGSNKFEEIKKADIVQITPFHNPETTIMAIQIQLHNNKPFLIGNNLSQENLIKVGLALKGTVTLSKQLAKILGNTEDLGDQLKDLAKSVGKSLINNLRDRTRGDDIDG